MEDDRVVRETRPIVLNNLPFCASLSALVQRVVSGSFIIFGPSYQFVERKAANMRRMREAAAALRKAAAGAAGK